MHKFTNIDLIYPAFMLIFSIIMIVNPRTMMRKAKYDEEGLKTESWVKKMGIGLLVLAVALGIYMFFNLK